MSPKRVVTLIMLILTACSITDGFQVLDYYLAKWSETVHRMQFAGNQTRFRSC